MAKASIITKAGTKIQLEGSPEEIARVLDNIRRKEEVASRPIHKARTIKTPATATDGILALREGGFFDKPRNLIQIKQALEEQGMIYPVTSLSGRVLVFVRKRLLGRIKQNKIWHYVKR